MFKVQVIIAVLKALLWIALIGAGIWYLSSSIGGDSIAYVSLESFLKATGACKDGICDIAASNGCFLCPYIRQLFGLIGTAAHGFWSALLDYIWILLALGFVIFLLGKTISFINENNKAVAKLDTEAKSMKFSAWFDPVWKQAVKVLVAGAFLGMINYGGTPVLKAVADITITPVMYVGSSLAMAATGTVNSATCGGAAADSNDILGPALQPFMCVIGNLNTVVLAGAAGGFALMNYAWMGMGGGLWTWAAGLALVLMFLVIGFDIFFKVLGVVFQLVFLIIFLPLIIAAWAYEKEWKLLDKVFDNSVNILAKCTVRVLAITLKVMVVYAMVLFAAREYFPGPAGVGNTFTPILPAGILQFKEEPQTATNMVGASVMEVFSKCEKVGTGDGAHDMDKEKFKSCFMIERGRVEQIHPGAFSFMSNGLEFFFMLLGLFLVYWYIIRDKIDNLLGGKDMFDTGGKEFEFGKYVKGVGQQMWAAPRKMLDNIGKALSKT